MSPPRSQAGQAGAPNLAPSTITRKTDTGLPRTRIWSQTPLEADGFLLAGAEDLAPLFRKDEDGSWLASQPADHGLQRDPSEHSILAANHPLLIHEERADPHWRARSRDDKGHGIRDLKQRRLAIDKGMAMATSSAVAVAVAVAVAMMAAMAAAIALGPWSGGPL